MAHIDSMPLRQVNSANEERSTYFPQSTVGSNIPSKFENGSRSLYAGARQGAKSISPNKKRVNAMIDHESVV